MSLDLTEVVLAADSLVETIVVDIDGTAVVLDDPTPTVVVLQEYASLTKADVGLANVDNTADLAKPVSVEQTNAINAAQAAAQAYADSLAIGLLDDRGSYDASGNAFPTSGGSGSAGAIKKGDLWYISVAGTLGGKAVGVGDAIRALIDAPGQTATNWAQLEGNLGYVPENVANKDGSGGYAGLSGFALNLKNSAGTLTSSLANTATAARAWTMPDKSGTVAMTSDLAVAYTAAPMTMATARLLGRTTASSGAAEEISIGSGLSLSAGSLSASSSATLTVDNKTGAYSVVAGDLGKLIRTTSGTGVITLPSCASVGVGFNFRYVCAVANSINISRSGSDTFFTGNTTWIAGMGQAYLFVVTDASASGVWHVISLGACGYGQAAISLGSGAASSGSSSIAIGALATANSADSIAIGSGVNASASRATAIGANSGASGSVATTGAGAMALGGSYASGTDSFAAAGADNSGTYGAKSANSIAIGYRCSAITSTGAIAIGYSSTASNICAVALGQSNTASGQNSFAVGNSSTASGTGSTVIGQACTASATYSMAIGRDAVAATTGKCAQSSGALAASGDAQTAKVVLRRTHTGATAETLTADGAAAGATNIANLPNDTSFAFRGLVIARDNTTDANNRAWEFSGMIRRGAGAATTTIDTAITPTVIGTGGGVTWTCTVTADTTNGGIQVQVTAASTVRSVCSIWSTEVTC